MSIEPHWHWSFVAYDELAPDGSNMMWPCEVTVTGTYDEDAARTIAASILKRKHYVLRRVYDCMACGFQEANMEAFKELVKNTK